MRSFFLCPSQSLLLCRCLPLVGDSTSPVSSTTVAGLRLRAPKRPLWGLFFCAPLSPCCYAVAFLWSATAQVPLAPLRSLASGSGHQWNSTKSSRWMNCGIPFLYKSQIWSYFGHILKNSKKRSVHRRTLMTQSNHLFLEQPILTCGTRHTLGVFIQWQLHILI